MYIQIQLEEFIAVDLTGLKGHESSASDMVYELEAICLSGRAEHERGGTG